MKKVITQKIVITEASSQLNQIYYVPQIEEHLDIEYHLESYGRCTVIDQAATDGGSVFITKRNVTITFYCADNAELTYFTACTNGVSYTQTIRVVLRGRHARARIRGVYAVRGEQEIIVQSRQEHDVGNTSSDVMVKGILVDAASVLYNGTIYVGPLAHKSRAKQHNTNLLIGENSSARVRSVPSLEVLANDVSCSHGSAAGQLNAEHLLYFNSRGIALSVAKELLVKGFIVDTIKDIDGIDENRLMASIVQQIR